MVYKRTIWLILFFSYFAALTLSAAEINKKLCLFLSKFAWYSDSGASACRPLSPSCAHAGVKAGSCK